MAAEVTVVPSIDLQKYMGRWHEIARFPNRFQRNCASDTTADYTLRPDGQITVLNQCKKADGSVKSAKGTAKLADAKGPNTKLKVTFFWPFYGDYWILAIDPDYQWVLVGEPKRRYLWILSRQPKMDDALYKSIVERAAQQGFDTSKLMRTSS